jgi:hypothetical protein
MPLPFGLAGACAPLARTLIAIDSSWQLDIKYYRALFPWMKNSKVRTQFLACN